MKKFVITLCAFLILGFASTSEAIILSGSVTGGTALTTDSGAFVNLGFPGAITVGDDNYDDSNLYGFNEDQNIVTTVPVTADTPAVVLPIGTTVASHYIFFDPGPSRSIQGYVIFDAPILAIMSSTGNLLASDFLANNTVTYLNDSLRGLESGDTAMINGINSARVDVAYTASSPGDYIRVLTARSPGAPNAVPEPMTMLMFGTGLAGAALKRKFMA